MKIILTIFCVCIILFGGGCAIILAGSGVDNLMLLPLAVVALNLAVLAALYGWGNMPAWPLYILAIIDFILAAGLGLLTLFSMKDVGSSAFLGFVPVLIAALKGYLTVQVAKNRKPAV